MTKREASRRIAELVEEIKRLDLDDGNHTPILRLEMQQAVDDREHLLQRCKEGSSRHRDLKKQIAQIMRNRANFRPGPLKPAARDQVAAMQEEVKRLGSALGIAVAPPKLRIPPVPSRSREPLNEAEILSGARWAVQSGKAHLLTEQQKSALTAAGEDWS